MTVAEAIRLVAVLGASFRQDVSEETAVLWAQDLVPYDLTDGVEAADIARRTSIYMPSVAEFLALVRDCRNTRVAERALPAQSSGQEGVSFRDWWETQDEEMQARFRRVFPKLVATLEEVES